MQRHAIPHRKLHRSNLQNLRTHARQLKHFLKSDFVQSPSLRDDPGVGGVDAVHVCIDLANIRLQSARHRDRRGIGTPSAQSRHIAQVIDALKAGDHGDVSPVKSRSQGPGVDAFNPSAGMSRVCPHSHLGAGKRASGVSQPLNRHRKQRDGLLLAGRNQHIIFTRTRRPTVIDRVGQRHQLIGFARHGGDTDNHVMTQSSGRDDSLGDVFDSIHVADTGPAKFLNNKSHLARFRSQRSPLTLPHSASAGAAGL